MKTFGTPPIMAGNAKSPIVIVRSACALKRAGVIECEPILHSTSV